MQAPELVQAKCSQVLLSFATTQAATDWPGPAPGALPTVQCSEWSGKCGESSVGVQCAVASVECGESSVGGAVASVGSLVRSVAECSVELWEVQCVVLSAGSVLLSA